MSIIKHKQCADCGVLINGQSIRCSKCNHIAHSGSKNPMYKHGKTLVAKQCVDCGASIGYKSIRCSKCAGIARRQGKEYEIVNGRLMKVNKCPECGGIKTYEAKRCGSCANKGSNNPHYDPATHADIFCLDCGKKLAKRAQYWGHKRCVSCAKKQDHFHNPRFGENSSNWQGGVSFEPYPVGWNRTFKEQIRHRDNYMCQVCGMPEAECIRRLDVHHIDYDKKNIKLENLITLCRVCHGKTRKHKDKEYWCNRFTKAANMKAVNVNG